MDEIVRVIKIEADGAEQTVAGLVSEIKNLTEAMNGVEKGTEQYTNILKELIDNQEKLGKAMKTSKQEATAAEGSYNALVKQMAALKKQWRETTDEASRKELGNQIKDINGKLKNMDASIGNFQRNVGNYADGVKGAFGQMGGAAKGMVGPLNSVKQGFNALSAHPLIGVLTALAALLINGIAKGFKSSEENTNKLRTAFAGFQAIGDAVTKMFQKLAGWIGDVANAAINLADKLGLLGPKFKERQEMMKKDIELEKKERDAIVKKAELETEAAELRAKASEEDNYSIQQRIQFLQEAQAKEQEELELEKAILEEKVAQLEAQMALTDSTGEELTKLNELKAQVLQVNAKISASQRSTNKEIASLRKKGLSDAQKANQERLNLEKDLIKQELDLAEEGSEDQLRLQKELRKKELEIQQEGFKTKFKNRKDYENAMKMSMEAYNKDIMQLEKQHARKEAEVRMQEYQYTLLLGLREGSKEYYTALGDIANKTLVEQAKLGKQEGETDVQFKERLEGYRKEVRKNYDLGIQAAENETKIINQIILNGITPMSAYYAKQTELAKAYYYGLTKLNSESKDEFAARQDEAWKAVIESMVNFNEAARHQVELFEKTEEVFYQYNDSVLDKLKTTFDNAKIQLIQATNGIQQLVVLDLENISKKLSTTQSDVIRMMKENFDAFVEELVRNGAIPEQAITAYLDALTAMRDAEKAVLDERYDNWMSLTEGIVDLTNNVMDAYEADLKYAVKHNKKSEEQAKKEFETIKSLRIAAAVVDTIQGAIAAFMGWQDKGQPWGAIIGATQAAATLAAGWAQIRQIQDTEFGSTKSSGGSTMMAQVTPVMPDYNPQMSGTLTGEQETEELVNAITEKPIRAYVVESDITSAQQVANQRQVESTF